MSWTSERRKLATHMTDRSETPFRAYSAQKKQKQSANRVKIKINLYIHRYQHDFGEEYAWHFFVTSHGKNLVR